MRKSLISFLIVISIFALAPAAQALNLRDAFKIGDGDTPLNSAAVAAGYNTEGASSRMFSVVSTVINIALSLLGVIFLLLIIYAGYLWMTARGNEQQAEKAKDIIVRAVIGLVVVLAAYAISVFVVEAFTKGTLTS